MTFLEEATRYAEVVLLAAKSEAADKLLGLIRKLELETSQKVRRIRSDRGGEFRSTDLGAELKTRLD